MVELMNLIRLIGKDHELNYCREASDQLCFTVLLVCRDLT